MDWAESRGIARERIAIDPGIGFGKTMAHNLEILRNLRRFDTLGCAVLIGTSRKRFLGTITGRGCARSGRRPRRSRRWRRASRRAGREGPRRRGDRRRDQGLGSRPGLGGLAMSTGLAVEVGEGVEPSAIITSSLCLDLAQQAKLACAEAGGGRRRRQGRLAEALGRGADRAPRGDPRRQRGGRRRRAGRGLDAAAIDRLRLDPKRVDEMAQALRDVAALPDPIGETIASSRRPNGLEVRQVRVPLGVIFMIYESRPNVTVDAAALCVKSGNAAILRGGKEAISTNRALHRVLADQLAPSGLPEHAVQLVPTTDRAAVGELLGLPEYIDLAIPRGGEGLIRRVVAEARMPVLKHYQGNCHVYVDARCDIDMGIRIILNAKVQRPGVCNAAETLLVHRAVAPLLPPQGGRCPRRRGGRAPRRPGGADVRPGHEARRAGRLGYRVPRQDPGRRGGRVD